MAYVRDWSVRPEELSSGAVKGCVGRKAGLAHSWEGDQERGVSAELGSIEVRAHDVKKRQSPRGTQENARVISVN